MPTCVLACVCLLVCLLGSPNIPIHICSITACMVNQWSTSEKQKRKSVLISPHGILVLADALWEELHLGGGSTWPGLAFHHENLPRLMTCVHVCMWVLLQRFHLDHRPPPDQANRTGGGGRGLGLQPQLLRRDEG